MMRFKSSPFFLISILFFVVGCNLLDKDYKTYESGLKMKLLFLGDGEELAQSGDYIRFEIILKTMDGNILYPLEHGLNRNTPDLKFQENVKGGLFEALGKLYEGDSAQFIISNGALQLENHTFIPPVEDSISQLMAVIKLREIITPEKLQEKIKKIAWKLDAEMNEHIVLQEFLTFNGISQEYFKDGIYVINLNSGNGKQPQKGDYINIHYKAYFLDSTQLDNTYFLDSPLEISWGAPDQLLEGFYKGINEMSEEGKAIFIIPSQYAFGERGSSNGSVPPYTSIIYEVELISIRN